MAEFPQIVRALVRPVVTVIFAAVIAQAVIEGINPPEWFVSMAIPIISWWFVERTVLHVREKK